MWNSKGLSSSWRETKKNLEDQTKAGLGEQPGNEQVQKHLGLNRESSWVNLVLKAGLGRRQQGSTPPLCSPQISTSPKPWVAQSRRCCPSAQQGFWPTAQHWGPEIPSGEGGELSTIRTEGHIKTAAWKAVTLKRWQTTDGFWMNHTGDPSAPCTAAIPIPLPPTVLRGSQENMKCTLSLWGDLVTYTASNKQCNGIY